MKSSKSKPIKKSSKTKNVLLAIAIAIILALFIGYGINTFYKSPKYNDFCKGSFSERPVIIEKEDKDCTSVEKNNRALENDCYEDEGVPRYDFDDNGCRIFRECDFCSKDYRNVRERYNRDVFIITLVLGLISILVGGVVLKLESVSSGVMAGGILTVIYGTLRYWGDMQDVLRWLILGIVLVILVWIGYKKLKK